MTLPVLLIAAAALASPGQTAPAPAVGSLCILAHPALANATTSGGDMPPAASYTLRIDGGRWVQLSTKTSVLLKDIPYAGRHKVAIRGDGRPWAAFTLTFNDAPDLCLYQNDFYLWWQLFRVRDSFASCRCKGVTPTPWTLTPSTPRG
jgi:hypothetical protein